MRLNIDPDMALKIEQAARAVADEREKASIEVMMSDFGKKYNRSAIDQRREASKKVLADLVRVCACCSVRSSQRVLVKADTDGTLLCHQCYQELTGKVYEEPKPVPKPKSYGGWS